MDEIDKESFMFFCKKYYRRNCDERRMYKEKPYASFNQYFEKNHKWLNSLYLKKIKDNQLNWSYNADGVPL